MNIVLQYKKKAMYVANNIHVYEIIFHAIDYTTFFFSIMVNFIILQKKLVIYSQN